MVDIPAIRERNYNDSSTRRQHVKAKADENKAQLKQRVLKRQELRKQFQQNLKGARRLEEVEDLDLDKMFAAVHKTMGQ